MTTQPRLLVAWTTTETREQAESLATGLVHAGLAACVQISAPIQSYFSWKGEVEVCEEYRITLKTPVSCWDRITSWIDENHPYETPQWVAVEAAYTGADYLEWACKSVKT